jgi:hypothetical protein
VGIGTTNPVNKLSVLVDGGGADDGIRIGVGSQGDGIKIVQRYLSDRVVATLGQSNYGAVTDSGALRLYDVGGTETVRLSGKNSFSSFITSGNVLIGTTTDAGFKLRVNGAIGSDNAYYSFRSSGNLVNEVQNGGTAVNRTYTAYSSVPMNGGKFRLAFTGYDRQCCLIKISVSGGWAASNTSNRHFAMIFNVQPLVNSSGNTIFVTNPTSLLATNISTGNVTATSLGSNNYTIDISVINKITIYILYKCINLVTLNLVTLNLVTLNLVTLNLVTLNNIKIYLYIINLLINLKLMI